MKLCEIWSNQTFKKVTLNIFQELHQKYKIVVSYVDEDGTASDEYMVWTVLTDIPASIPKDTATKLLKVAAGKDKGLLAEMTKSWDRLEKSIHTLTREGNQVKITEPCNSHYMPWVFNEVLMGEFKD